jgi:ATP-binding cassette subfamily F protein 3
MRRGDRIALVGPNGAGKSTFIKLIAQAVKPTSGTVRFGANVTPGWFAQHQTEAFNVNDSCFDTVAAACPTETNTSIRTALGVFGLRGKEVDKKIGVLSGGEKGRVALSILALTRTNLLLLDEPTNHLDLAGREALEAAMAKYAGAVVVISHDRAFIDGIATKVVHIEDGALTIYEGVYTDYEAKRAAEMVEQTTALSRREEKTPAKAAGSASNSGKSEPQLSKKEQRREAAAKRDELKNTAGPLKKRIARIEEDIAATEEGIADGETELANPAIYEDGASVARVTKKLKADRDRLHDLMAEWERISTRLAEALSQLGE